MKTLKIGLLVTILLITVSGCSLFKSDSEEGSTDESAKEDESEDKEASNDDDDSEKEEDVEDFDLEGEEKVSDGDDKTKEEKKDDSGSEKTGMAATKSDGAGTAASSDEGSASRKTASQKGQMATAATSYGSGDTNLDVGSISEDGSTKTYTVNKHETLMLIAFKLYGDYSKWKQLAKWNPEAAKESQMAAGTLLKYYPPQREFVWQPEGSPYLIKRGDTLGIISSKVYGTPSKWKPIFENNRPMIKNPNLIFAGFTLYYKDGKDLASLF